MGARGVLALAAFLVITVVVYGPAREAPAVMQAEPEKPLAAAVPLVIVGEGGTSGYLFQYAANTYVKEHGGVAFTVHDGDEFVAAMKEFFQKYGAISRFVYMGHGNEVGLYVNQAPGVNGALYVNDPALNASYRAASIYDLPPSLFASGSTAIFYGCNVARTAEGRDSFAEQFANHFRTKVTAPTGPTEFSFDPAGKSFLKAAASVITRPVYMVPTVEEEGFIDIVPSSYGNYDDLFESAAAATAFEELRQRGLKLEDGMLAEPYRSITNGDANAFCRVLGDDGACDITGAPEGERMRNTTALKLLLDAAGFRLARSGVPYAAQISFAASNGLLTPEFTSRRWYSRAEMAMLTRNILRFKEERSRP